MKYNLNKKLTIGAARTLRSLQQAMLALLCTKAYEAITVGELCEKAMLPRATFYNYFEDKYDLLNYCLMTAQKQLDSEAHEAGDCKKRMNAFMENCIDYLDQNLDTVQKILKHNQPEQYMINQIRLYLLSNMEKAFQSCPDSHYLKVPQMMAAKLYSEAVLIILEWIYLDKKECTKEQAKEYLRQMVSGIEAQ